jgi:hypothetical protein
LNDDKKKKKKKILPASKMVGIFLNKIPHCCKEVEKASLISSFSSRLQTATQDDAKAK